MRTVKDVIKVRGGSDVELEFKHTKNGVLMVKPEKDMMDFALWFPLEFLNQNDNHYSIRWVFNEANLTSEVYKMLKMMSTTRQNLKSIELGFETQD